MDEFEIRFLRYFRGFRDRRLLKFGQFFLKIGITANRMTFLSLTFGLTAIYFLFTNNLYFVLFAMLHLLLDALDGVIARASKETKFGRYFDYLSDRSITLLALLKIGWFLGDYYAYVITGLFILAQAIYLISRMQAPILFTRTIVLITLIFNFSALAYLIVGVAAVYSLARQLQWFTVKK